MQLKLEGLIVKDTLAGHTDIHSAKTLSGGALGTYAISFWQHFQNKKALAENLISLLRQNWYTQNYAGSFFMKTIPHIAQSTNTRADFISAFRIAISNDARIIKNKLEELPADWVTEIRNHA